MDFFTNNFDAIGIIGYAIVNVLNAITPHWSGTKGITKAFLIFTEAVSVISSLNSNKSFKLPGKIKYE